MNPVKNLRAACLASALLVIPTFAGAQTASEPLPVLSLSEEPALFGIENQAAIIVEAPVPPARPVFEARRKIVRSTAANRVPVIQQATIPPARVRPVEPVRVAMARTFWLTVGNGF